MPQDELVYEDVEPVCVPCRLAGKRFVLREANEDAVCKFRNAQIKCTNVGPDGNATHFKEGMADTVPLLVSLCLYHADDNGNLRLDRNGNPDPRYLVSLATVRSWKDQVVKGLFKKVAEISDLKGEKEETTEESLRKQKQEIDAKLNALEATHANGRGGRDEDPTAGLPAATTAT
jgi:hypothetical protein